MYQVLFKCVFISCGLTLFTSTVNIREHLMSLAQTSQKNELSFVFCMLMMCTAVGAEASGGSEKNQLLGGTWRPEAGPAFIPVSYNVTMSDLSQQPVQRIARRLDERHGFVKNYKNFLCYLLIYGVF